MEGPNSKHKDVPIDRVIGVPSKEEKEIRSHYKFLYDVQFESGDEIRKTPETTAIIKKIVKHLPEFIRKYGGKPLKLIPRHFHELRDIDAEGDASIENKNANIKIGGLWIPSEQKIEFVSEPDVLTTAQTITHEALHASSFHSLDVSRENGSIVNRETPRRIGLMIKTKSGEEVFRSFNEAVIEALVKRFDKKYFNSIPELASALRARERARTLSGQKDPALKEKGLIDEIASYDPNADENIYFRYMQERFALSRVMYAIHNAHKDKFKSVEDVFEIFAKAAITGRLLELARIIEKTYGKGSFRKIEAENLEYIKENWDK